MSYTPRAPSSLRVGSPGSVIQAIAANHNEVWDAYEPPLWHASSGATAPLYSEAHGDTSYHTALRGLVRRLVDNVPLVVTLVVRATATAKVKFQLGGVDSAETTVSAGSTWTAVDVTGTPSASLSADNDRELVIMAKSVSTTPNTIEVLAAIARPVISTVPAGVRTSGWTKAPPEACADGRAISTEFVGRLMSGPGIIAADRPVCIVSGAQSAANTGATAAWNAAAVKDTNWHHVAGWSLPEEPGPPSTYRGALYLTGSAAQARVWSIAGIHEFTGAGWHRWAFSSGRTPYLGQVLLRAASSVTTLQALQVWRDAG